MTQPTECGCKISTEYSRLEGDGTFLTHKRKEPTIEYCSKHAAAPDGYEAARRAIAYLQGVRSGKPFEEGDIVEMLMDFVAKAEGGN